MEEAKAAAYYDELSRKGGAAARFKQGLGFSSSSSSSQSHQTPPSSSSSSFYSSFVRASTTTTTTTDLQNHQSQLDSIHKKLSKKPQPPGHSDDEERRRSRSSRDRERESSTYSRERKRSRSRSRSPRRRSPISRSRSPRQRSPISRSRSPRRRSPRRRSPSSRSRSNRDHLPKEKRSGGSKNADTDYSRLIDGYSQMTPAEKVKAKMKLQLSQTAKKDMAKGINTGWERFDFNKEAPLDDEEEEIEVAEDDASLVKNMGKSFRFTAVEAKREDDIRAAHDEAMFGAPAALPVHSEEESAEESEPKEGTNNTNTIISDKVVAMQQGSWRDRVRKPH